MMSCHPDDHSCHLCGDVAHAGRVLVVERDTNTATVLINEHAVDVAIDLVPGVEQGDTVLVHLGFAIERVSA